MMSRRQRRERSRLAKSKKRSQTPGKSYKASRNEVRNAKAISVEPTYRLLLSSLRYWEVERDLIEERIAAIHSVSAPL